MMYRVPVFPFLLIALYVRLVRFVGFGSFCVGQPVRGCFFACMWIIRVFGFHMTVCIAWRRSKSNSSISPANYSYPQPTISSLLIQ